MVAEQVLTYHLPDAASAYYPLQTSAAWQLSPIARRESTLAEWNPTGPRAGSASEPISKSQPASGRGAGGVE
jgi:hypothetical protein